MSYIACVSYLSFARGMWQNIPTERVYLFTVLCLFIKIKLNNAAFVLESFLRCGYTIHKIIDFEDDDGRRFHVVSKFYLMANYLTVLHVITLLVYICILYCFMSKIQNLFH